LQFFLSEQISERIDDRWVELRGAKTFKNTAFIAFWMLVRYNLSETGNRNTLARLFGADRMGQDFTPYQQKIIKRYYNNEGGVKQQRLAELVTELYLAEGKKRLRVWSQAVAAMQKLEVPQARIDHLVSKDNPVLLAELVKELEGKK
jgi:hypothetical protein